MKLVKTIIVFFSMIVILILSACNAKGNSEGITTDAGAINNSDCIVVDKVNVGNSDILESSDSDTGTANPVVLQVIAESTDEFQAKMSKTKTSINVDDNGNIVSFNKEFNIDELTIKQIVYSQKLDGSWGICIEYKPLNELSVTSLYLSFNYFKDEKNLNNIRPTITVFNMELVDSENNIYQRKMKVDDKYDQIYSYYYPDNNTCATILMEGNPYFTNTDTAYNQIVEYSIDLYNTFCIK